MGGEKGKKKEMKGECVGGQADRLALQIYD